MNACRTIFAAMLMAGVASAANAQGMAAPKDHKDTMAEPKDTMAKSGGMMASKNSMAMSAKPMKHDGMKKGAMQHDSAMKHDSMKSDSMAAPR